MQIDDLNVKGTVNMVLRGPTGKVKAHRTIRNMVTAQGLAHIIGRMMDAGTENNQNVPNTVPNMMRYMAIGDGGLTTVGGTYTSPKTPGSGIPVPNPAREASPGVPSQDYLYLNSLVNERTTDVVANRLSNFAFRIDMGGDRTDPGGIQLPAYSPLDQVYQGTYNAATNQLGKDAGTSTEGIINTTTTPTGTKKIGDRLVFVAVFQEYNPGGLSDTVAVTEAGIFNAPYDNTDIAGYVSGQNPAQVYTHERQTMLCRTTFAVVNKAPQDSLQITWSVALADNT